MKRFSTDMPADNPAPEEEKPYVESLHPKSVAEMWKEYSDEFAEKLPDHERYNLKHAFYYAIYELLVDYDKIPDRHEPDSEPLDKQLELWNEEASTGTLNLAAEFYKRNAGLPHVDKPKIEGN